MPDLVAWSQYRAFRNYLLRFMVLEVSLLLCGSAEAQITEIGGSTSTPAPGVGHDYSQEASDTVNPADGSVSFRLGVPVPPGRALTVPFAFAYDSNGANYLAGDPNNPGVTATFTNMTATSVAGWSYTLPQGSMLLVSYINPNPPYETCRQYTGYTFQDFHGARHNLGLGTASLSASDCRPPTNVLTGGDSKFRATLPNLARSLQ
jgi:hypothetical protein